MKTCKVAGIEIEAKETEGPVRLTWSKEVKTPVPSGAEGTPRSEWTLYHSTEENTIHYPISAVATVVARERRWTFMSVKGLVEVASSLWAGASLIPRSIFVLQLKNIVEGSGGKEAEGRFIYHGEDLYLFPFKRWARCLSGLKYTTAPDWKVARGG